MIVHLIDGTYELFRHFYGLRRAQQPEADRFGAVRGVLWTVLQMIETGATHIGVATDHVIESFRNGLWAEYKTGAGIDPKLFAQFHPLERALEAMGVAVWPMVELEADDALASAAALAAADPRVEKVCIWTPDKDLAQCVVDDRVVQVDRRGGNVRDADGVRARFGVDPASIPDYLALVGDSADGYPGLSGWGGKSAAAVLARFHHIERIPRDPDQWRAGIRNSGVLAQTLFTHMELALLFRTLATLRTDAALFEDIDDIRWRGPSPALPEVAAWLMAPGLVERVARLTPGPGSIVQS
jgi:5'-3' exonuclease